MELLASTIGVGINFPWGGGHKFKTYYIISRGTMNRDESNIGGGGGGGGHVPPVTQIYAFE